MADRSPLTDDEGEVRELTEADFNDARPATEALPELVGDEIAREMLKPKRGRPKKEETKELVSIRLSPEVLRHFRSKGEGWQTQIDEALKEKIEEER